MFKKFCSALCACVAVSPAFGAEGSRSPMVMQDDDGKPMTMSAGHPDINGMEGMEMFGMYGAYAMNREASGTSWQPDATPDEGIRASLGPWMAMIDGYANDVYDDQGGPRGASKNFSASMLMVMAQRNLGDGTLGVRGMFSLDPLMGKSGYPLLFESGESANGVNPLIDRQHPHDLVMELAGTYSVPLTDHTSVFGYLGIVGEPALGPPAFMHRFSGEENPEAPITHHSFDSTHISNGVATAGYIWGDAKLEASSFNGREPDEYRYRIETASFDSWSARASWNPSQNWSLQISQGYLASPAQLQPNVSVTRRTASAIYQTTLGQDIPWGTTIGWGQNSRSDGVTTDAQFVESTLIFKQRYTLFARAERVGNDEYYAVPNPLEGHVFEVSKLSAGGIDDLFRASHVVFGLGGLVSRFAHPAAMDPAYGHPTSYMIFVRAKIEG